MSQEITVGDYARETGAKLKDFLERERRADALDAIRRAESDLLTSNVSKPTCDHFWELVAEEFHRGLPMRKAENSAFHQLMREIETALQAKKSRQWSR